jgi:peptidoglycan/LPS O-acetylase OafA/YrhL
MVSTPADVNVLAEPDVQTGTPPARPERLRLDYIDGIRGLAALAVVILHAFEVYGMGLPGPWREGGRELFMQAPLGQLLARLYDLVVLRFAWAVEVFIVVSGFSLMLPIVRSQSKRVGSYATFLGRRVRRILPPYYAAMAVSLLMIALVPGMGQQFGNGRYWDMALPAFDPGVIISHLFLVHNFSNDWSSNINPPMWSIAVEWQIYLIFPLLVLIFRRWGALVALAVGIVVGVGQGYGESLGLQAYPFSYPWFLALFSMGMFAAWLAFDSEGRSRPWSDRIPWLLVSLGAFASMFGLKLLGLRSMSGGEWITDPLLGLSVSALLVYLAKSGDSPLKAIFSAPWVVKLGHFSYSLYLIHTPFLTMVALGVLALGLSGPVASLTAILIGVPVSVLVAYPFYLAFERPFMKAPARKQAADEPVRQAA